MTYTQAIAALNANAAEVQSVLDAGGVPTLEKCQLVWATMEELSRVMATLKPTLMVCGNTYGTE